MEDFCVLIGRNDAGKSTVFAALSLYLDGGKPDASDYSVGGDGRCSITCTVTDLPSEIIIDDAASTTLELEHLLREDGQLAIRKTWVHGKTAVEVAAIALHPVVDGLEPLIGRKLENLKNLASDLGVLEQVSDRRVNAAYRRAIWDEWARTGSSTPSEIELALNAEDGKQVAREIQQYFPLFQLFESDRSGAESDQVAQDPAKAIVKSVLDKNASALADLAQSIADEITAHLADVVVKLEDFAPDLASELKPQDIVPGWQKAFSAVQFVDSNGVSLAKRGSGTRRLVLLSFFRAEAERKHEDEDQESRRGLIIAVEEPETALHPDLQRESLRTLMDVASMPGRQVFVTTHSTNLVQDVPIDAVRYVTTTASGQRRWASSRTDGKHDLLAALTGTMGRFTDHSVKLFLLVEGKNDIEGLGLLTKALAGGQHSGFLDLIDAESRGQVCFIPIGGCGAAALWESRLAGFDRPEYHLLDSDRTAPGGEPSKSTADYVARFAAQSSDRVHVHVLDRRELENYLTLDAVVDAFAGEHRQRFEDELTSRAQLADWAFLDIPRVCAEILHDAQSPAAPWVSLKPEKQSQKESRAKKRLAQAFAHPTVAARLIVEADNDLLRHLRKISDLASAPR